MVRDSSPTSRCTGKIKVIVKNHKSLVQRGVNKPPIPNQQNLYAVFILTFDFRLAVLAAAKLGR
jgi:hypothetical protein